MIITGKKVILRPIDYSDTEDIVRWRNSDFVRSQFLYRALFTKESHEAWMRNMVETGKVVQFIMLERQTGEKIGSVYLRDIDYTNRKCEFGIFIGEEDKLSCGYGREAAELITDYAFRELKLYKVFLRVLAENQRARKSYLRAGFQEEGTSRAEVWLDGVPRDVVFMSRLGEYK